jgi:methionyl-tRNA formyltransferase
VITVLCSDKEHPAYKHYEKWCQENGYRIASTTDELPGGEYLFLVSCTKIISKEIRDLYKHTLVIHESDLPKGRGWSPLVWQVLEGKNQITICLLEAADDVDTGDVWYRTLLLLDGTETYEEIHEKAAKRKISLMTLALFRPLKPVPQTGEASWYPKRFPKDSRIDPEKPLSTQFDLLRVCDPRFPAFFTFRGSRYELYIKRV